MDSLLEELMRKKKEYRTKSYSMSIGEILNLYRDDEIEINPEFQRFFRWRDKQKSMLIESILLGIPIPPIFVYQRMDGVWEVVDGLQRISTILEFFGVLKDDQNELKPQLKLKDVSILTNLNGKSLDQLEKSLVLEIKRSKFNVEIIENTSHQDSKFEVFMRLNTGGSFLTAQELRNAWLVMYNKGLFEWFNNLATDINFRETLGLSDKLIDERYDLELCLAFFVYPEKYEDFSRMDKADGLTKGLQDLANRDLQGEFDRDKQERIFRRTFELIHSTFNTDAFCKYYVNLEKYKGGLLESVYEVIAIGLANNIDDYEGEDEKCRIKIEEVSKNIWTDPKFTNNMGSGTNTKKRIPVLIPYGFKQFEYEQN
jgi:uncharacterized protein with ParB-like and HNH nuclease domain